MEMFQMNQIRDGAGRAIVNRVVFCKRKLVFVEHLPYEHIRADIHSVCVHRDGVVRAVQTCTISYIQR